MKKNNFALQLDNVKKKVHTYGHDYSRDSYPYIFQCYLGTLNNSFKLDFLKYYMKSA